MVMKRHLFPSSYVADTGETVITPCVISPSTREMIYDIATDFVHLSRSESQKAVKLLDATVPRRSESCDELFEYDSDLRNFRSKNTRAPCGYVGLRNLSNTCYFNSLMTQLYMNVGFRRFMLEMATSPSLSLIQETQALFAQMQESHARSIDTWCLVRSIKTYDDTIIDVHNQMDVDEFYNLLFDRWEGQMPDAEGKKSLRSFYGGQLVQQVKSRECDHVSTRKEPFQAIQCDIKGKSTLAESLEAYVGGEVMAGENKYKCSTCNREVVAVKRACLEEIPDNLIFHLKRFDFSLRTMQRAKINDHFSFPVSIDMRPYTMEYLESVDAMDANGQAPQEDQSAANGDAPSHNKDKDTLDMFELVGILVHAGTAESGHYYSFIRERPTHPGDSHHTWLQFNDDMVAEWDPSNMEGCTFGGTEMRADHTSMERHHSAYMLFYERVSALERNRAQAMESEVAIPQRVPISHPALLEPIQASNLRLLRQYCTMGPPHIKFVQDLVGCLWSGDQDSSRVPNETDGHAVSVIMGHMDHVVSRIRDYQALDNLTMLIHRRVREHTPTAMALVNFFHEHIDVTRYMVQKHPEIRLRERVTMMYLECLERIKLTSPSEYISTVFGDNDSDGDWDSDDDGRARSSAVDGLSRHAGVAIDTVRFFRRLWSNFHANIRTWPTVFKLVTDFARMGALETVLLLSDNWLFNVMRVIWHDRNESQPQLLRMRSNLGKPNRPLPNYDSIVELIRHLLASLAPGLHGTVLESAALRLPQYMRQHAASHDDVDISWTADEINLLHAENDADDTTDPPDSWIEAFFALPLKTEAAIGASEWIIGRLISLDRVFDVNMYRYLSKSMDVMLDGSVTAPSHIRSAVAWCLQSRQSQLVKQLIYVPASMDFAPNEARYALDFFVSLTVKTRSTQAHMNIFRTALGALSKLAPKLLFGPNRGVRDAMERFMNDIVYPIVRSDIDDDQAEGEGSVADGNGHGTAAGAGNDVEEAADGMNEEESTAADKETAADQSRGSQADESMADDSDLASEATVQAGDESLAQDDVEQIVGESCRAMVGGCLDILETHTGNTARIKVSRDTLSRVRRLVQNCSRFFGRRWLPGDEHALAVLHERSIGK
jgi:ubiquitin carboxyl-terminal hydrolase 34